MKYFEILDIGVILILTAIDFILASLKLAVSSVI